MKITDDTDHRPRLIFHRDPRLILHRDLFADRLFRRGEGRFEYVGRSLVFAIGPQKTRDIEVLKERLRRSYKADKAKAKKAEKRAWDLGLKKPKAKKAE